MNAHLKAWFTEAELKEMDDPSQPDELELHDRQQHAQFFKASQILPQQIWVPKEIYLTPEANIQAEEELGQYPVDGYGKAVAFLSRSFFPHGQHEYALYGTCDHCKQQVAYQCIVCGDRLCNGRGNIIFPF